MSNPYLTQLRKSAQLTSFEESVLESVGIQTPEDLISLTLNFPQLGTIGVDISKLSFAANMSAVKPSFNKAVQDFNLRHVPPPTFAHGANVPLNVPVKPGYQVPLPAPAAGPPAAPPPVYPALDFRFAGWPVKDQGSRGTCVAFSMIACREHLAHSSAALKDLSEQYLFWATKASTADPDPNGDGTWIEFARDALNSPGTCLSSLWPYVGTVMATVTQATAIDPSASAHADAPKWSHVAATYQRSTSMSGNAAKVVNTMNAAQRPAAISIPVFGNPHQPGSDNWNTGVGIAYGRVLDPPPTSVVVGGHAVCFTGFVPDPTEPSGGWFILRNSWGTTVWANSLPSSAPYFAPERGYGQISASYVDKYLMEMCLL